MSDTKPKFWSTVNGEVCKVLIRQGGKLSEDYINSLKCPACGKREAWASSRTPTKIHCNRANKCGVITPIDARVLVPHLFQDFRKRHPANAEDPKATARAFLKTRALDPEKIEFEQGEVTIADRKYPTVGFRLDDSTINHRIVDYLGKDKTRTHGKYTGKVWQPQKLNKKKPIHVTEAVIDSLSLIQGAGCQSVSCLSASHIPKAWYESLPKGAKIVLAFDNDNAGTSAILKHLDFLVEHRPDIKVQVELPPPGQDWNDLLQEGVREGVKLDKHPEWEWNGWRGQLLTAGSVEDYHSIYSERYSGQHEFFVGILVFAGETWRITPKKKKVDKQETVEPVYTRLLNGKIELAHDLIDRSLKYEIRVQHRLRWTPQKGSAEVLELPSESLSNVAHFRNRLTAHRGVFHGSQGDLNALIEKLFRHSPPRIRQLYSVGHDPESGCIVFPERLYDCEGKVHDLGKNGFFENFGVSPFLEKNAIAKITTIDTKQFLNDLKAAFGNRGLLALGYWTTAAYSHILFAEYNFFPFLSLHGEPRTGKSYLTTLLNRCFGIDWEGVPTTTANTKKGELRRLSQFSGMVAPMLEARSESARFDFDSILPLYNRNPLQVRAATSNQNETIELPFRSCLAFVQNIEQFRTRAAMERVVSIPFSEKDLSDDTFEGFQRLNQYAPDQLAALGDFILQHREDFENGIVASVRGLVELLTQEGVMVRRIAENHAISMSGMFLVSEVLECKDHMKDLNDYVIGLAKAKIESARSETPLADAFLELIENVDAVDAVRREDGLLYVRLSHALKAILWPPSSIKDLHQDLKQCDRFQDHKTCRCFGNPVKAWVFTSEDQTE